MRYLAVQKISLLLAVTLFAVSCGSSSSGNQIAFSGSGNQIAFSSDRDGDDEIFVMNADGTEVRQLTDNLVSDWEPSWSPDGNHIVFTSDRDGDNEIFVMNADGTNLYSTGQQGDNPDWGG